MSHQDQVGKKNIDRFYTSDKDKKEKQNEKDELYLKQIRPSYPFDYYAITTTDGRGSPEMTLAVNLIMKNGDFAALQYHNIMPPIRCIDGATLIEISTSTLSIIIKGENLNTLFRFLLENRVVWIKEPDGILAENDQKKIRGLSKVKSIEVEDRA